jgi:hypothetical protein
MESDPLFNITPLQSRRFIEKYHFPYEVENEMQPHLWPLAASALREWFTCLALRGREKIALPSRGIDWLWQIFEREEPHLYQQFCQSAYGKYAPYQKLGPGSKEERAALVAVLKRVSIIDRPLLLDFDQKIGISDPWSIDAKELQEAQPLSKSEARGLDDYRHLGYDDWNYPF